MENNLKEIERITKAINADLAKKYKGLHHLPLVNLAEHEELLAIDYVPLGIPALDDLLGGGIPRRTTIAIHGKQWVGKTSLAWSIVDRLTRPGRASLFVNTEPHAGIMSEAFRKTLSLKGKHVVYMEGLGTSENIINAIMKFVVDEDGLATGNLDCIVIDSINNLITQQDVDKFNKEGAAGVTMATRSKLLTQFLEKMEAMNILRDGSVLVLIAQDRANLSGYGADTVMSGGMAIRHNSKLILNLTGKALQADKKTGKIPGHTITAKTEKNKVLGTIGSTEYTIMYGQGVDDSRAVFDKALEFGYIVKGKKEYRFLLPDGDRIVEGGVDAAREFVKLTPSVKLLLVDELIKGKPKTPPVSVGFVKVEEDAIIDDSPAVSILGSEEELAEAQNEE